MNLFHIFEQQDIVLTISFGILVLMSVISWSIIAIRLLKMLNVKRRNIKTLENFWQSKDLKEAQTVVGKDDSVVAQILQTILPSYQSYQQNKDGL